jgi:hypothetical protein
MWKMKQVLGNFMNSFGEVGKRRTTPLRNLGSVDVAPIAVHRVFVRHRRCSRRRRNGRTASLSFSGALSWQS